MGIFDEQSVQPEKKQTPQPVSEQAQKESILEIHLPGRPVEETVTVRTKVNLDDEVWVAKHFSHVITSVPKMGMATRLKLADRLFIHRLIQSWTLTSEGQALTLDDDMESQARWDTIRGLPQTEQDFIYARIQAKQRGELGGHPHISPQLQKAVQSRGKR